MSDEVLSLNDYRALTAALPRPSVAQRWQFAEFITSAHSWYKHLPLLPPGGRMQLYLDPAAGMQRVTLPGGQQLIEERLEPGFHYSWLRTAEYRERFGYLAFSRADGTSVALCEPDGTHRSPADDAPQVFDTTHGRQRAVPDEIVHAGRAFISGLVHSEKPHHGNLLWALESSPDLQWHPDSGGAEQRAAIIARCRELGARSGPHAPRRMITAEDISRLRASNRLVGPRLPRRLKYLDELNQPDGAELTEAQKAQREADLAEFRGDPELLRLLEPECQRQRAGLVAAMDRVLACLDTGFAGSGA